MMKHVQGKYVKVNLKCVRKSIKYETEPKRSYFYYLKLFTHKHSEIYWLS
jgi:hypothetical protein